MAEGEGSGREWERVGDATKAESNSCGDSPPTDLKSAPRTSGAHRGKGWGRGKVLGFSDDHHTPHVTGCTATVSTELLERKKRMMRNSGRGKCLLMSQRKVMISRPIWIFEGMFSSRRIRWKIRNHNFECHPVRSSRYWAGGEWGKR